MIVPYLSQFCWHPWPGDPCHDSCDAAWQSRDDSSQNVTFRIVEKMFSEQQKATFSATSPSVVISRQESGQARIFTFSRQEVRAVVDMQTWAVLLITPCRSHGHLDSSHSIPDQSETRTGGVWPIRRQDAEELGRWFISRCHHSDSVSECSTQHRDRGQTTRWSSQCRDPGLLPDKWGAGDSHRYPGPVTWSGVCC